MKAVKLKSGSYRVQAGKTINGKFIRKSFTADTAAVAKRKAIEWQTTDENTSPNMTLSRAYQEYMEIKKNVLSPSSLRGYDTLANSSFQDLMNIPINKLNNINIQKSVNAYSINHSPKTVRNAYGLLIAVLKAFMPHLYIDITLPQKAHTEPYIPDEDEIKRLLEVSKGTPLEIPILLAVFGPLRRGEICALTSEDIDGNKITINKAMCEGIGRVKSIKAPKTLSSNRTIEMPDFVIDRLKGIDGKITELTPNAITVAFRKLLEKNGFEHFRFHDLRHFAVSSLHAANIPDKYIMARGGWATDRTMQNVYNHTLKNKEVEIEDKITEHFNSFI